MPSDPPAATTPIEAQPEPSPEAELEPQRQPELKPAESFGARIGRVLLGPPEMMAAAPVTRAVLLSTMVVFVAQVLAVRRAQALVIMPERAMLLFGANYSPFVWGEHRVELLLTSVFLHVSFLHIAFNLYALRQVGPFIERVAGSARFTLLYIVSGIVGSVCSAATPFFFGAERLSAGASGAICGLIGAALVVGMRTQGLKSPIARSMGFWLVLTVAVGSRMNADNAAHIGGAMVGVVMAATWRRGQTYSPAATGRIAAVAGALVVAAFTAVAARDLTDPYASITAAERAQIAVGALVEGRCEEAESATAAAIRVHAPKSDVLQRQFDRSCGP